MGKALGTLAVVLALLVGGPLAWYAWIAPEPAPTLPPPGHRVVLASGLGVNVIEAGSGPPVLLVHGLPGCAEDWRPSLAALAARGRHAIAYDRISYGHSDARRDDDFTIAANARELGELLDALALDHVVLVGWSYGGGTALRRVLDDPSHVAELVLVGSVGSTLPIHRPGLVERAMFSDAALAWVTAVPPVSRAVVGAISAEAYSGGAMPPWWVPQTRANLAQPKALHAWKREEALLDVQGLDTAGVSLPVLVVAGSDDRLVPYAVAEALAEGPTARLDGFAGGSHMLPITQAGWLADQIAGFGDAASHP